MAQTYEDACNTLRTPIEWLDFYAQFYSFWTELQTKTFFSKWMMYTNYEKVAMLPNSRQVLQPEIIFDIDDNIEDNLKAIKENLDKHNMNYSIFFTGNRGFHLHMFVPDLIEYTDNERPILKRLMLDFFTQGLVGVDKLTSGNKRLILLEYSKHRKSGRIKELVEFKRNSNNPNIIPKECLMEFDKIINQQINDVKETLFNPNETPKCIKFLESDEFFSLGDGVRRGAFIMTSYYKTLFSDEKAVERMLNHWVSKCKDGHKLKVCDISYMVRYTKPRISCRFRKEFLHDLGKKCGCES